MVVSSRQAGCRVCGFDGDGDAIGGYFFDLYACLEIVGSLATCKKFCSDAPASFSNAAGEETSQWTGNYSWSGTTELAWVDGNYSAPDFVNYSDWIATDSLLNFRVDGVAYGFCVQMKANYALNGYYCDSACTAATTAVDSRASCVETHANNPYSRACFFWFGLCDAAAAPAQWNRGVAQWAAGVKICVCV